VQGAITKKAMTARMLTTAHWGSLVGAYFACGILFNARSALGSDGLPGELLLTRESGAEGCPDRHELARKVLSLGVRQPVPPPEPVQVDVTFWREGSGYAAIIRASGGKQGLRELSKPSESCAELGDDVSVVVAVLFDIVPETPPAGPPATPIARLREQPLGVDERASQRSARPASPVSKDRFTMALGAQAGVGYGFVGAVASSAFGAALRPRFGRWEASVGILGVPVNEISYEAEVIEVSLLSGRVGGCVWLNDMQNPLGWAACLGLLVGAIQGHGRGFDVDLPASDLWFAGEAQLNGRLRIDPWGIRWGLSLLVPRPHTFSVENEGVVVDSPPVAGLLEVGVELQIP
jgi:hypothetical protein